LSSRNLIAVLVIAFFSPCVFAQGGPSRQELDMAAKSPAYRLIAERFVAAAAARDVKALENLLSPAISARAGKEGIQKVLNEQVLPFFTDHKEIGRSVTTTNTTDATGHRGFTFYMYSMTKSGQKKPFVIYIVEEKGQKIVANILVNYFIEGRHQ
jgi:hypothetical protein